MAYDFNDEEILTKSYDSRIMRRLLKFALPYKWLMLTVIILMVVSTFLNIIRPNIFQKAIDDYMNGYMVPLVKTTAENSSIKIDDTYFIKDKETSSNESYSLIYHNKEVLLIKGLFDYNEKYSLVDNTIIQNNNSFEIYKKLSSDEIKLIRSSDIKGIKNLTIFLFLTVFFAFILGYFQTMLLQYTGQKIIFNLRNELFKHIEKLNLSFFDNTPVGKIVTRITNDVQTLNEFYTNVLVFLLTDIFMVFGILIFMFLLDIKLAVISLTTIPFIIVISLLFKKHDRNAYRIVRAKLSRINAFLSENISGMKVVQTYNREDKKFREFENINKEYKNASLHQIKVYGIFRPSIELFSSITMALIIWFGGIRYLDNGIQFGVLFAFINYITMLFQPILDITEKYDILQSAMASAEKIFSLLDNEQIIENPEKPITLDYINGKIEFKNVWFAYRNEDWILKDVSFTINPGEKVAFVGATGAGKTSIISLITRLYDIQKGEILIDDVNIKNMSKDQLRQSISTVLQDVFLFTGDIENNIKLNEDSISSDEVIKASKYVNAHTFISKLPEKYKTAVNERGTTLSQGQRQLIAFARAIAFNPPILVLDEATSNIDTETESLIQDALEKITKDRTTIIVAHRLSTIKNSNKIIVLHKGRIKEEGSHEELLKHEGLYYNLYKLQYSK